MPGELFSLTFFELQSLYLFRQRQTREIRYNAYISSWPHYKHENGDRPDTIGKFWPLPGDPEDTGGGSQSRSIEDCERMAKEKQLPDRL